MTVDQSAEEKAQKLNFKPEEYELRKTLLAQRNASPVEFALLETAQAYGLLDKVQHIDPDFYHAELKSIRDHLQPLSPELFKKVQYMFEYAEETAQQRGGNMQALEHSRAAKSFEKHIAHAAYGIMKHVEEQLNTKAVPDEKSEVKWLVERARHHAGLAHRSLEPLVQGEAQELSPVD